jgi:hypothetical protein
VWREAVERRGSDGEGIKGEKSLKRYGQAIMQCYYFFCVLGGEWGFVLFV